MADALYGQPAFTSRELSRGPVVLGVLCRRLVIQEAVKRAERLMGCAQIVGDEIDVLHRHVERRVTEKSLQHQRVSASSQEVEREGMPEAMRVRVRYE